MPCSPQRVSSYRKWAEATPPGFMFAVKGSKWALWTYPGCIGCSMRCHFVSWAGMARCTHVRRCTTTGRCVRLTIMRSSCHCASRRLTTWSLRVHTQGRPIGTMHLLGPGPCLPAGRFITHTKRCHDVVRPLANFLASGVLALGEKLGPVVWQLPPNLPYE